MGALKLILAIELVGSVSPVAAWTNVDPVARWRPIVAEASTRFGIPQDWIERVVRSESGGLTTIDGGPIRSSAGAMGLMQLMPATWAAMRAVHHLGADPDDPHDNIIAGTAFLRLMRDRFGYPGMFAAYSAGPTRYADYLAGRSRLPAETIAYVERLTGTRSAIVATATTHPSQFLFTVRHDLGDQAQRSSEQSADNAIFAIRKGLP